MEKGKPRIKRKSTDESEKEEPEKVKQKLQKEPLKNSKRKLDTDSRDEQLRSLTLEGRRRSGSLDVSEVSKSSRNPSEERELEGSSTYPDQKRVNHGYTHTSGTYEHKNTRLLESKTNSTESKTSRTMSSESKRGEFYKNMPSPRVDQKVLEMLEKFEDETDLTLFKFVSSVANGTINPVTSVDALRTKFHGVCKNSTLVFKVLDLVSFFLDDPKKKQYLLPFLESLESFGLVSSMEIISVIDPSKLDSCNYSEGLVKISIRERTKNNYVLKIYNLFRENYQGYTTLSNYLSSVVDKHSRNGFRFDVVQKHNKKQSTQNRVKELDPDTVVTMVNKISGLYKLCPMRTLYEVLKWLVLNNHSDEFVKKVLNSYPAKKVSYLVLLYLRNNYQNKDSLISRLGKEGDNSSDKEKTGDKEKATDKEVNLTGYSNDNIYKIAGLMVCEKVLNVSEVYNYLDPPDELLSSLSDHFYNVLKTSPNKDTRDNSSVPVPLLKKIVTSHLNSNVLNSRTSTSKGPQVTSPRMKDKDQMSAKLEKENKLRKTSHTMLEGMVNKYECNDLSILLKFDNYHYLKDCVYSMESGKFLVLSTLLSQCTDFEGELWDVCYSYILHLYSLNFPIFLNTTVTQSLTHVMSKVLNKSPLYQAGVGGNDESDSVKLTLELLDEELIVVKKLEYYFKLVGFRSSENIILFNEILSYLHTLLSHLLRTQVGKEKNDKCLLGKKMIKKLICKYILFSVMNCCEGNFQISDKIWNILNLFTTLERYQIYSRTLELLNGEEEKIKVSSPKRSGKSSKWSQLENYYYKYQMCMIRKLYQTYNYKLRNIFKKITFELLKSVKSPTIRSIVSIITAISAINPFSVCTLIIRQSELFNNLLLPLCELTKYFLSYTIDIFVYQLTINLIHLTNNPSGSGSRDTSPKSSDSKKEYSLSDNRLDHNYNLNEEESNKMYVNSVILCKIYKRHSECDIIPIVTILILILNYSMSNRLTLCPSEGQLEPTDSKNLKSKLDNEDLVKLEITGIYIGNYYNIIFVIYNVLDYLIRLIEIIGGMVDVDMNKMTQEQLLCQCGSYALKNECLVSNVDDEVVSVNNKKSLVKVVCRPFFVNSLLLILGRLINELLYDSNFSNSKLLLAIVDKFNNLVMLLINFLEINEQTHLLPSKELLLKYYTENHLQFMNTVKAVKEPGESSTDSQSGLKRKRMEFTTAVDTMLDDNFIGFINSLSIYDIYAPTEQYDTYISKLNTFLSTISTTAGAGNTFRRVKRIKNRISTLETDKEDHVSHSNVVLEKLKEVFKSFVKNDTKVGPHITTRFISRIVFSRLLVSELNALFCCKIVDLIMENKMNYFNYFDFVNCYTKMLIPMISSLTEREVISLSIFFNHSFHLIKGWVNNREAFEKLVYDNPCFCTTFKFQPNREFKYQQLLQVIKKWEYFILLSIFSINKPNSNNSTNTINSTNTTNNNSNTNSSSNSNNNSKIGDLKNSAESEMVSEPESVLPQKRSWIEIKNVVIFLNKVSSNFPITVNSSLKVLNFLKNVLKLAKQNNWQDVTVPSNTLIKLIQMYQNQNKYIVINIPSTSSASNPASSSVTAPSTPINAPAKNPISKELSPGGLNSKENSPKNLNLKENSPKNLNLKEMSPKNTNLKESFLKVNSKEASPRSGPSRESSLKSVNSKENSPKTSSKDISPRNVGSKDTSPRSAPVKEAVKSSGKTTPSTHGSDKK